MAMIVDQLRIPEMTRPDHAGTISTVLQAIEGVWQVRANIAERSVRVEHDETVSVGMLIEAVRRAGYQDISVLV